MTANPCWHGMSKAEHVERRDEYHRLGYRFSAISLYGSQAQPLYAAVMTRRPGLEQHDHPLVPEGDFQGVFDGEVEKGFGPVLISASGSGSKACFSAVFEAADPIPLTRIGLRLGEPDDADETTIIGMNRRAKLDGLIPVSVACYGTAADPRYAAIWRGNAGKVVWNADGAFESADEYVSRFLAQTSGWCRPAIVTRQEHGRYFSLFVDDQIAGWTAFHRMTGAEYQDKADEHAKLDEYPVALQASGATKKSARYSVVFARSSTPIPRQWRAEGPREQPEIDAVIKTIMKATPVRQASLAIVHGDRLVYTKGYTWAEPSWPVVQPTTCFRIGSVSKVVSALAAYQLLEQSAAGAAPKFGLDDRVQDILGLAPPGGGTAKDPRLAQVTVRHLLEHSSGVRVSAHREDAKAVKAHQDAGVAIDYPVSAKETDAYIASCKLSHDPGANSDYNNAGYYLLGRVLAKMRGESRPIDAFAHLFQPLGITRIRRARSLPQDQEADDARSRHSAVGEDDEARLDIQIATSVMTNDQPQVPYSYGNLRLEKFDGTGGLAAAAPDLARVLSLAVSTTDSPALRRSTVVTMLENAIANKAAQGGTYGHGWDSVKARSHGSYSGRKAGSIFTGGCVAEFEGDWGYVMNWAGKLMQWEGGGWSRDFFQPVMSIAMKHSWPEADLFPQFLG